MSTASMRWSPGRKQSWRRVSEGGFDARRYAVAAIAEAEAREYVLARHYSGTWPAVVHRYGLFDMSGTQPRLTGVAALSVPAARAVLTNVFPGLAPSAHRASASTHLYRCRRWRPVGRSGGPCIDPTHRR